MSTTTWAVTQIAHPELRDVRPNCQDCLALTSSAIITARATGSRGATHEQDGHSVTVARAIQVVTG